MNLAFFRELPTLISTSISSAVAQSLYAFSRDALRDLGPHGKWKIGPAKVKQTEQDVTLFLFETGPPNDIQLKMVLDTLRHEAQMLQRLRHPQLLSVESPLVETRAGLSFAVKCVRGNLAGE